MCSEGSVSAKEARLTRYQPGSLGELWAIAWPLMLASFSGSCMTFIDRAILARYQTEAFVACSTAQPWIWTVSTILHSFLVITEIFVGRFNGAREYKKIGPIIWQMLIIALSSEIFLIPLALNADCLLASTVKEYAFPYLRLVLLSIPFDSAAFGVLGAFFVGRGETKQIPIILLCSGILNIILDVWFVFGGLGLPSMGVEGAALATNFAHILSFLIFFVLFIQKRYHGKYAVASFKWSWSFFKQCFNFGMPNAIGNAFRMIGLSLSQQILALHTPSVIFTAYSIAFTVFSFMFFVTDGIAKGVGTLSSNFIGAEQPQLIGSVFRKTCCLVSIFAIFFFTSFIFLTFSLLLVIMFILIVARFCLFA